jgi:hypothetical protein
MPKADPARAELVPLGRLTLRPARPLSWRQAGILPEFVSVNGVTGLTVRQLQQVLQRRRDRLEQLIETDGAGQ